MQASFYHAAEGMCNMWCRIKTTVHAPKHLKESTGFEGEMYIMCYKSHLLVLKENKPISRDSDLDKLISTCTEQSHQLTGHHSLLPRPIFAHDLWTRRKIGFGQSHYENWDKSTYNAVR